MGPAVFESDPLQLIVQHPAINRHPEQESQQQLDDNQRSQWPTGSEGEGATVCRLLCTSKALRAAIAARCNGQVTVKFTTHDLESVRRFAWWLSKHGHLLKALQLDLNLSGRERVVGEALIAGALQRANGVSCMGLQLQTYKSYPACAGQVLEYLPAPHLKHLELGPRAEYCSAFALEGLTRLQTLHLQGDSADTLLPAVSSLTHLTRLTAHGIHAASLNKLKWIPAQLQSLHMSMAQIRKGEVVPPLTLGHLTALTQLSSDDRPLILQAGDKLPSSLKVLRVRDCLEATPLLGLTGIEVLDMSMSTTAAVELVKVAQGLGCLREVRLCYGDMTDAAAAAAGWSALPLRSLGFQAVEGVVSLSTLDQLARLQGLTCLDIYGGMGCCRCAGKFEATPQQFAAVLGQMTGLQELGLRGVELLPEESPGTGMSRVMKAISHLPQLYSLTVSAVHSKDPNDKESDHLLPIDEEAAGHLAGATQLTSLVLCDCGLQDDAVNRIAANLKGLRRLKLDCNPDITSDVLPEPVAKVLHQLSELCVLRTGIRRSAEGFKARLVLLHPGLKVKSSAR